MQVAVDQVVVGMVGEAGEAHPGNPGVGGQVVGHGPGVGLVALEPHGHRLKALEEQECIEGGEGGAAVAQLSRAGPHGEGPLGESRAKTTPWKAGSGWLNIGKRSGWSAHGNRPPSTMAPPRVVPWPPTNLVSEWTTTSAPCSKGLSSSGVATVLSTMRGTPSAWATAATASRSTMLPAGLPMVSQKTARVFSSMSGAIDSARSSTAKRVSMPRVGSTWAK